MEKYIGGETTESFITTIANVLDMTSEQLLETLKAIPEDLEIEEINAKIESMTEGKDFDYLYLFHLTRCTPDMKQSIKEKGLVPPMNIVKTLIDDIIKYTHINISREQYEIVLNKVISGQTTRNLQQDGNYIYGLDFFILSEDNMHFLRKERGPELVEDLIRELEKIDINAKNYRNFTTGYIIKMKARKENLKDDRILYKILRNLYCSIQNEKIKPNAFSTEKVEKIDFLDFLV